jgi:hypothetical protein
MVSLNAGSRKRRKESQRIAKKYKSFSLPDGINFSCPRRIYAHIL